MRFITDAALNTGIIRYNQANSGNLVGFSFKDYMTELETQIRTEVGYWLDQYLYEGLSWDSMEEHLVQMTLRHYANGYTDCEIDSEENA